MMTTPGLLRVVAYRLGQVRQQLGFVAPLSAEDKQEVQRWLPASALVLFDTMSHADQQHSLRVCRGLQAQGCVEHDMLAAALLHDVGKAQGRVPFWTRPVIVLGKLCMPRLLARVIVPLTHMLSVGTDLSRPSGIPTADEDVINRSLQNTSSNSPDSTIADEDVINRSLQKALSSHPHKGRDKSVPTWRRALSYAWWHAEIGADLAADAGLSERAVLYIRTHHEPHGPAAALHRVDEVS